MKFTVPCWIKKNTQELRTELEKIGYQNRHESMTTNVEDFPYLCTYRDGFYFGVIGDEVGLDSFYVDCGENELLFLAIASKTDNDAELGPYYTVIQDLLPYYPKGYMSKKLPLMSDIHPSYYRQSTVNELKNYFKRRITDEQLLADYNKMDSYNKNIFRFSDDDRKIFTISEPTEDGWYIVIKVSFGGIHQMLNEWKDGKWQIHTLDNPTIVARSIEKIII